ncbi:MAG: GH3 auxin-responsive promoter family protein, partial [Saprospiraceae bacterium]
MKVIPYLLKVEQAIKKKQLANQDWCWRFIVRKNNKTHLGQQFNFDKIKYYSDFRQIPLSRYEQYEGLVQQVIRSESSSLLTKDKVIAFLKTSGTTSEGKLLPITHQFTHSNHYYGSRSLMYHLVANFGFRDYLFARNLSLSGYQYSSQGNYEIYDMSALLIKQLPFYIWGMNFPNKVFTTWEGKLEYIVEHLDSLKNVRVMLGVPTWILSLLNYLSETTGKPTPELFPNWQVYLHGGVNFQPYRKLFNDILEREMIFQEVYNASEGFFAFQDAPDVEGMLLLTGGHIFYEFIPFNSNKDKSKYHETIIPLEQVEVGKNYLIVISTEYGLYRYILGDVIQFTYTNPYRLKVVGRESEYINAFGEDLSMYHVNNALKDLSKELDFQIRDFSIAPQYAAKGKVGGHQWLIEFIHQP